MSDRRSQSRYEGKNTAKNALHQRTPGLKVKRKGLAKKPNNFSITMNKYNTCPGALAHWVGIII